MDSLAIVLALVSGLPDAWFTEPILPPDVARDTSSDVPVRRSRT